MKQFSANGQKWLKSFHLFFACLWAGGAVAVNVMNFFMKASNGMELYGINLSMKMVDDFIIIPGAMGSLLTGILYAVFTKWGWFKHNWISVKWGINLFGVVFGTFWLGPWLNSLPSMTRAEGMDVLSNPVYMHNKAMLSYWGLFQALTIVAAIFISALKPWKKRKVA